MATSYNTELDKIKRQRAIADALRASGNEPLPASLHPQGRFDAPVSGWEYASRAVNQMLGAYLNRQADKKQDTLDQEDKANLDALIQAKRDADAPDVNQDLNPAIQSDEGPTQVPAASIPLTKEQRKAKLQAAVMRGVSYGGSSGGLAGELAQRELLPPVKQDYTLGYGDMRVDGPSGQVTAVGMDRPVAQTADDRALVNVVDPKSPKGYRTIRRSDWNGEQEYQKPTQGQISADAFTGPALDIAAERYRQTGVLPTGIGRQPQIAIKIMQMAGERATALGDDANATVIKQNIQKAAQGALANLTKQQTMVRAFENTASKNLALAKSLSDQVDRQGVRVVDRWIQAGKKNLVGDKDVSKFHAANETFINEYAKIMSGSMGNTQVSDAARNHAHSLLDTAMDKETYDGVVETLQQEMDNRLKGFSEEAANLMGSVGATGDIPGAPKKDVPLKNAKGWVLHDDGQGNQAYVSPDGKQYEEVK